MSKYTAESILNFVCLNGGVATIKQMTDALGCTQMTIFKYLRELRDADRIYRLKVKTEEGVMCVYSNNKKVDLNDVYKICNNLHIDDKCCLRPWEDPESLFCDTVFLETPVVNGGIDINVRKGKECRDEL